MMMLAAFALIAAAPVAAQETRTAEAGARAPAATLADLAWLEGTWRGDGLGAPAIEVYSAPAAGQIAGHFVQTTAKGGVEFYELMQIVPRDGSLVYRLRHFNPDLTGWEDAKAGRAVEFPLVAIAPDRIDWNGMSMRREGADAMTVWVRIGGKDGAREVPFRYVRVKR